MAREDDKVVDDGAEIRWSVADAFQPGTIINYGPFDTECLEAYLFPGGVQVALLRIDDETGTIFRVSPQLQMPDVPVTDPRLNYLLFLPQPDLEFLRIGYDPDTDTFNLRGNWTGPGSYTEQGLIEFFGPDARRSLESRPFGVRAPDVKKVKLD